ncbi:DUF3918 family protein [Paenarthrobacter sp. NPDC090517]|uniref:DUF3918 family protein n=1 Tax=Paenarthrobacter sp. NPDC090517 TaxID=3364381 RepID=UPI00382314EF
MGSFGAGHSCFYYADRNDGFSHRLRRLSRRIRPGLQHGRDRSEVAGGTRH